MFELLLPPVLVILGAGAFYFVFKGILRLIAMASVNKGW